MKYDLIGRKEIMGYLRLTTWRNVTRRIKDGLPVVQEPGERGRWLAASSEIDAWIVSNVPKVPQMH